MSLKQLIHKRHIPVLFWLMLWVLQAPAQTSGLTGGATPVNYTNTKYAIDLDALNGRYDPATERRDGIKAQIQTGGYVQVDVIMSIVNWANPSNLKDQIIYSVKLDQAGTYNSFRYTSNNEITYDKAVNFHVFTSPSVTTATAPGNDLRKMLQLLRSKFESVCKPEPSWWNPGTWAPTIFHLLGYNTDDYKVLDQTRLLGDGSAYSSKLYSVLTGECEYGIKDGETDLLTRENISDYPVKVKVTLKNATFYSFYHPSLGTVTANDMLSNTNSEILSDEEYLGQLGNTFLDAVSSSLSGKNLSAVNVFILDHTSLDFTSISTHAASTSGTFSAIYKSNSARTPYFKTAADTIGAFMGDVLCVAVKKTAGNSAKPVIKGIPGVWISPFNATMQFICSPNITPGEFNPFIPWESQTHQKNINTYPTNFKQKVPDWQTLTTTDGTEYWVWAWTLQRQQNYKKTSYKATIEFPNTKSYSDGHTQRSEQSAGHQAEFLHYWKKGKVNNVYTPSAAGTTGNVAAPKYTMTIDPDEILYVNSYKMNQITPENRVKMLMAPTFQTTVGSKNYNLIPWQYTWPEEQTSFSYNTSGYPSGGFLLNDYITEYRKFKEYAAGNTSYNTYYDGYLIEDYDTYRSGTPTGTSVNPSSLTSAATCGDNCWFNPSKATGNNTNPGVASITYGGNTYSWRMNVVSPIRKSSSDPRGFYGTIEGTNNPMGWGTPTHYRVKGLSNLSKNDLASLRLTVLAYRPAGNQISQWDVAPQPNPSSTGGRDKRNVIQQWLLAKSLPVTNPYNVAAGQIDPYGGTPYVESEVFIPRNKIDEVQRTGIWDANISFIAGQAALALYMTNRAGEPVLLAGRNVVVMDPTMFQFAAPGSNSYPYSKTSLVGSNEIDLKEGEGEKAFEFLNDFRESNDETKGYSFGTPSYPAQRKFIKTYVLIRGQKVTFTTRDIGIGKTELFMSAGAWPWSGYYDMSRFMPTDSVAKYMTYTIKRITDDYSLSIGSTVSTVTGRNLSYTWNEAGDFAIELKFMGNTKTGYVRVIVKDYPSTALDDLTSRSARGTVKIRNITPQEEKWLRKFSNCANPIFTLSSTVNLSLTAGTLKLAYVEDVPSLYKFAKGPRATNYSDRFGEFNDYNNKYTWYGHRKATGASTTPVEITSSAINSNFVQMTSVGSTDYLHRTITDSIFPASWSKVFLRHCSSNHFPTEDVTKSNVLSDPTQTVYKDTLASIYSNKLPNQTELGYMRIFPWIAKTPTDGYKIFRFNKGSTDLSAFFNGSNNQNGAWSGAPYYNTVPYVQERMQMGYPSINDDGRNFLEFYNNLYYGRYVVYSSTDVALDTVYNVNPKLVTDDNSKPDKIFIASVSSTATPDNNQYLQDLFRNSYRVFEECRDNVSGIYHENYKPKKSEMTSTSSSSVNGMALIALCIAHRMQWDSDAEKKAEQTVAALTRHLRSRPLSDWGGLKVNSAEWQRLDTYDINNVFSMSVTSTGKYPYHYFDVSSGVRLSDSHNIASTVDAAILCYGVMFARKYFSSNRLIDACAKELYNSIDWNAAFKSGTQIYHAINDNGSGDESGALSLPFNEYTILAYLAKNQTTRTPSSSATTFFSNLDNALNLSPADLYSVLPANGSDTQKFLRFRKFTSYYKSLELSSLSPQVDKDLYVLSDDRSGDNVLSITALTHSMPSNFTTQFCYYLCHSYTANTNFKKFLKCSAAADYTYWRHDLNEQSYFGSGAGSSPTGYSADAPFNNSLKIVSPHIAIGFLPIMEENPTSDSYFRLSKSSMLELIVKWCREYDNLRYENAGLKYVLSSIPSNPYVLWRLSKDANYQTWQPVDINVIDFSTELFGLASVYMKPSLTNPNITGANFFETYNNIFDTTVIPQEPDPNNSSIWSWWNWFFGGSSGGSQGETMSRRGDISEQETPLTGNDTSQSKGLIVYPNPTDGILNVVLPVEKNTSVKITVNSMSGQEVYSNRFVTYEDNQSKQLSLYSLSTGIYIVTVTSDDKGVIGRSKVIIK